MWRLGLLLVGACGRIDFTPASDAPVDANVAYRAVILADSPLAYYRLDETSDGVALDETRHGNDAQLQHIPGVTGVGAVDYKRPGAIVGDASYSVRFLGNGVPDGSEASIETMTLSTASWGGDFTIEGWVRPSTDIPSGWRHLFFVAERYTNGTGGEGFRMGWDPSLTPTAWSDEAGGTSNIDASVALVVDEWNHLAFVHEGTRISIYINGELGVSAPFAYAAPVTTADYGFGAMHGMPSNSDFDELAVYGRALTVVELAAHVTAAGR